MCFARPGYLVLLWLIVPLMALVVFGARRKLAAWVMFDGGEGRMLGVLPELRFSKFVIRRLFLCLSAFLMLFALAGPELCSGQKPVRRKGIDVIFMLDVSNSMYARDGVPDRLSRAKSEFLMISRKLGEGRKALLLFAGAPVVQCPLTGDEEDFEILLDMASPDLIVSQGTDYRRAFEAALRLASSGRGSSGSETVLVLASDGEDHGADSGDLAAGMKQQGVHLHVIGVGSSQPVPIVMPGGPKRDREGHIVMTSFRPELLASFIKAAGGRFYYSRPEAPVHDAVSADIAAAAAAAGWVMVPGERVPVHQELMVGALLLFISASVMTDVLGRSRRHG
ncbi:MAG: VWA domain-containing protein [Chlorobiaceae bacterium]|nr:VWA domain-containing protein [Chlorobiaceae bacterium]